MKKTIVFLLLICLVFGLFGCKAAYPAGSSSGEPSIHNSDPSTPTEPSVFATEPSAQPTETTAPTVPADLVSEVREDGLLYQYRLWDLLMSSLRGIPVWFKLDEACYPGMEITVDLSLNMGEFEWLSFDCTTVATLENNMLIYWDSFISMKSEEMMRVVQGEDAIFIEGIIRADGNIVGYCIHEIGTDDGFHFGTSRCETVCFPMVDGQLQNVPEWYVLEKLAEMKQVITPFDYDTKRAEEIAYLESLREQTNPTE